MTWLVLPLVALIFWLPFCVRWVVTIGRSVKGFRDGYGR